jgi:two-component system phosphate regulon response regulator PhoB/two-component system alkaline phosphatase synthesis response regulator PhoP
MVELNKSDILVANSNKKTIFVVDDEPDIIELVDLHLNKAGFRVKSFEVGIDMLSYLAKVIPDLIILDLMLPDYDGLELCKLLKKDDKYSHIPIIMLTARSDEMDRVLGLEIGADDYITKPFSTRELVARVKAVLRRDDKVSKVNKVNFNDLLEIDFLKYEVTVQGVKIDLTSTEFKILRLLAEKPGWVFSRESILDSLGVNEKGVLDRTVDVHIKNLREKLGSAGKLIKNIRGIGYKIDNVY